MREKEIIKLAAKKTEKMRVAQVLNHGRMAMCAEYWKRFQCGQCSREEFETFLCHDRFCPYCQRFRAAQNAIKLHEFLSTYTPAAGLKLLTLTVKNMEIIREKDIRDIRRWFKNLRYRLNWSLDLEPFDPIAGIARWTLIILFDIGLLFGFRRMAGD